MTAEGIRNGTAAAAAASFDPLRPLLTRVAYRMLGSVADAEDVVQDAFIRWLGTDRDAVREPAAFLRRTVTRLCLDQIKSARAQRETYIGPWLPDPLVEEEEEDDVTLPLMLALERLSPLERAAFLLHDVFGVEFEEVARTIDRDPAATGPIMGYDVVMKLHRSLAVLFGKYGSTLVHIGMINGLPGFVTREADGELQTTALDIEDGRIVAIYVMRNPDKLRHMH